MEDDYDNGPPRFIDIPEISDATVRAMAADLRAAGLLNSPIGWDVEGEQKVILRLQIMGHFWREFGGPVWVRSAK